MDASGSVRDDWSTMLNFVVDVAKRINISPEGSHIGLVRFGDDATKVFDFTEFDKKPFDKQAILDKITSMPRPLISERSFINRGLRLANRKILRRQYGMRPDVKQVLCRKKPRRAGICMCTEPVFQSTNRFIIGLFEKRIP